MKCITLLFYSISFSAKALTLTLKLNVHPKQPVTTSTLLAKHHPPCTITLILHTSAQSPFIHTADPICSLSLSTGEITFLICKLLGYTHLVSKFRLTAHQNLFFSKVCSGSHTNLYGIYQRHIKFIINQQKIS